MRELQELYNTRKQEIEKFIELIKFLQNKEMNRNDEGSDFDKFFHGEEGIRLSYQDLSNILKSNLSLMIYNLIEFTVVNLVECIYDRIERERLAYIDINDCLKKLWTATILKFNKDPNASYNTFIKKNEYIIGQIISKSTISLKARDTLPGGNFDGEAIKNTMQKHGVVIDCYSDNYRPDILKDIREKRNDLAHGAVSFVEALRDSSIKDIAKNNILVSQFLDELIKNVAEYLDNKCYKNT